MHLVLPGMSPKGKSSKAQAEAGGGEHGMFKAQRQDSVAGERRGRSKERKRRAPKSELSSGTAESSDATGTEALPTLGQPPSPLQQQRPPQLQQEGKPNKKQPSSPQKQRRKAKKKQEQQPKPKPKPQPQTAKRQGKRRPGLGLPPLLKSVIKCTSYTIMIFASGAAGALAGGLLFKKRIEKLESQQVCSEYRPECPVDFRPFPIAFPDWDSETGQRSDSSTAVPWRRIGHKSSVVQR